jgi:D-alanyl-D-alanine carboxypeptidase
VQAISNTAYACAVLKRQHGGLLAGLTLAVERGTPLLSPQQLANTAWALAKLDVQMPETLEAIVQQLAEHHIGIMNAQDIANVVWALARLDCVPKAHLQARGQSEIKHSPQLR